MTPSSEKQMTMKRVECVQVVIAEADFVVGAGLHGEMGRERGCQLQIRKGSEGGVGILCAGESAEIPFGARANISRKSQLRIIQQKTRGTVVAAGDARRLAIGGLKFRIVIEAEISEAVSRANVGMVAANGFADIAVDTPAAIRGEILAGVKTVGVVE